MSVLKLKQDLNYKGHVYFEAVRPHIIYQALAYLKAYNKFYRDISIVKGLSRQCIFKFSNIAKIQGETGGVTEKNISDGKEMIESINNTQIEKNLLQLKIP